MNTVVNLRVPQMWGFVTEKLLASEGGLLDGVKTVLRRCHGLGLVN
jgi:hypothetical protein